MGVGQTERLRGGVQAAGVENAVVVEWAESILETALAGIECVGRAVASLAAGSDYAVGMGLAVRAVKTGEETGAECIANRSVGTGRIVGAE